MNIKHEDIFFLRIGNFSGMFLTFSENQILQIDIQKSGMSFKQAIK